MQNEGPAGFEHISLCSQTPLEPPDYRKTCIEVLQMTYEMCLALQRPYSLCIDILGRFPGNACVKYFQLIIPAEQGLFLWKDRNQMTMMMLLVLTVESLPGFLKAC